MIKKIPTGFTEDPRPKVKKNKDWKSENLFGSTIVDWKEKTNWLSPYLIRNQDGSSQCMAYSGAKGLGINEFFENGIFVNLSPTFIYNKRSNRYYSSGREGMWMQDLLDIMVKYGSPKDEWFPCDGLSESHINNAPEPSQSVVLEALKYRGSGYSQPEIIDIDSVARAIDVSGWAVILIRCNIKEWTTYPYIDPAIKSKDWNVNHGIIATDYGLINGKKYIQIEDSWGSSYGKNGLRWISEDFLKERLFGIGHVFDLKNIELFKPKYTFTKDLKKSILPNKDVVKLQEILVFEGLMSKGEIGISWGYFGKKTFAAVIKLQEKYSDEILKPVGLTKGTGYVGLSTRAFLNKKYG